MKKNFLLKFLTLTMLLCLSLTVLAACGAVNTEIRFIVDGEVYETVELNGQSSIKLPKDPKKEDCVFEGWFLDKDKCMQPFLGDIPETIQVVLEVYGKWSETPCEHEWTPWDISVAPTCVSAGKQSRYCLMCGKREVGDTEKLQHNFVNGVCANSGCGLLEADYGSKGLSYALNPDGESYSIVGIGTCTESAIIIPVTYNSKPVTKIAERAFENCGKIKSVIISNCVTSIGDYAFCDCGALVSVTIHDNVTFIGNGAFQDCRKLISVTIGNGISRIVDNSFYYCNNLQYNEYDNGLYLGNSENPYAVFVKAKDESITSCEINEKTKIIYSYAFLGCVKLTSITIPNSVTCIGSASFGVCGGLTNIVIPDSVTYIGEQAFAESNKLTSVDLGCGITFIGESAFENCSIYRI